MKLLTALFWRVVDPIRQQQLELLTERNRSLRADLDARDETIARNVREFTRLQLQLSECRLELASANAILAERHWSPGPDTSGEDPEEKDHA